MPAFAFTSAIGSHTLIGGSCESHMGSLCAWSQGGGHRQYSTLHHPPNLDADSLTKLLELMENATVYPGNPDERFTEMVESRKGKILSDSGAVAASLEEGFEVEMNGQVFPSTVRTASCTLLEHGSKCRSCHSYRSHLRSQQSR